MRAERGLDFDSGGSSMRFPLDETGKLVAFSARMDGSKQLSLAPTDLIDWMNAEGLLDLDWDFPHDGDLYEAGLDDTVIAALVMAVEDEYGVELGADDLTRANLSTPAALAKLISSKAS